MRRWPEADLPTSAGSYASPLLEFAWSKPKAAMKGFGTCTVDALDPAVKRAIDLICAEEATAWHSYRGSETIRARRTRSRCGLLELRIGAVVFLALSPRS